MSSLLLKVSGLECRAHGVECRVAEAAALVHEQVQPIPTNRVHPMLQWRGPVRRGHEVAWQPVGRSHPRRKLAPVGHGR